MHAYRSVRRLADFISRAEHHGNLLFQSKACAVPPGEFAHHTCFQPMLILVNPNIQAIVKHKCALDFASRCTVEEGY